MIMQWILLFLASTSMIILICLAANLKYLTTVIFGCVTNLIIWFVIVLWPIYRKYNIEYTESELKFMQSRTGSESPTHRNFRENFRARTLEYRKDVETRNKKHGRNYTFFSLIQFFIVFGLFILNFLQCIIQIPLLPLSLQGAVSLMALTIGLQYCLLKFIMVKEDSKRYETFIKSIEALQLIPPEDPYPAWSRFIVGTNNIPTPIWIIHEIILVVSVSVTVVFLVVP